MQASQNKNADPLLVMKMVWAGLFVSVFIYGMLVSILATNSKKTMIGEVLPFYESPLFLPLSVAAGVLIFLAAVLPKLLFKPAPVLGQSSYSTGSQSQNPSQSTLEMQSYFVPFILRMVLFEAIAILGFVLSFSSAAFEPYLIFAGITLLGFLTCFPRASNLQRMFSIRPRA